MGVENGDKPLHSLAKPVNPLSQVGEGRVRGIVMNVSGYGLRVTSDGF